MLILDACVGAANIYYNRERLLKDDFISIDIRKGDFTEEYNKYRPIGKSAISKENIIIKPIILANMKYLPFKEKIFDVIICDPPHLNISKNTFMGVKYGSWNKNERTATIYRANMEFARVLKDNGMLILKILPEVKDNYESLFTNFIFYLPIQTIRDRGCMSSKEAKLAAIWLIGILKDR